MEIAVNVKIVLLWAFVVKFIVNKKQIRTRIAHAWGKFFAN